MHVYGYTRRLAALYRALEPFRGIQRHEPDIEDLVWVFDQLGQEIRWVPPGRFGRRRDTPPPRCDWCHVKLVKGHPRPWGWYRLVQKRAMHADCYLAYAQTPTWRFVVVVRPSLAPFDAG